MPKGTRLCGLTKVILRIKKCNTNLKNKDWVTVKGTIRIEKHKLYKNKGPVLYVEGTEFAVKPNQEVATFY